MAVGLLDIKTEAILMSSLSEPTTFEIEILERFVDLLLVE